MPIGATGLNGLINSNGTQTKGAELSVVARPAKGLRLTYLEARQAARKGAHCRSREPGDALLGVFGSSNGGLLAAVMGTQRPDLFGAVVSDVPLADMMRFPGIAMGGAWMGE